MKEVYYWLVTVVLLAIGAVVYHFLLRDSFKDYEFLQTLVPIVIGAILTRIGVGIEEGIRGAERKGRTPGG